MELPQARTQFFADPFHRLPRTLGELRLSIKNTLHGFVRSEGIGRKPVLDVKEFRLEAFQNAR
jgi:hypothetical protein